MCALLAACGGKDAAGPSPGSMTVAVVGVPAGASADVAVTGPNGFSESVLADSSSFGDLDPGTYTVAATAFSSAGTQYVPTPATQAVSVRSGARARATVQYAPAPGSLTMTVSGLPGGTPASVTVTGPAGYDTALTAGATLAGLAPGSYTVAAAPVGSAPIYDPTPLSQSVNVASGGTPAAAVTYAPRPAVSFNLVITNYQVNQGVQTPARTVPLVAGRAGLLRVYVTANQANTAQPEVRARFYRSGTLIQTVTIPGPPAGVPTDTIGSEGSLARTWNALLPASLLQAGTDLLLDVDPTNVVAESSDGDNSYPVGGTAASLGLRTAATLDLRLVPIRRTADNTTGNATAANAAQFADQTIRMHPLATVNVDVRATYTYTDTAQIQSNDNNGVWLRILNQMNALQAAEGGTRNYYGVISVPYSSGVAGYGYVPGRAAVGWDRLPSGSGVAAHELGHNFGRSHAPCGGAGSPDPNYPYAGGVTGVWGYDLVAGTLKAPTSTDLMGYCGNNWISDYTYMGVMSSRGLAPPVLVGSAREPSLIVWGRINDGEVILEPAFVATTEARLPAAAGPNLVTGLDATGRESFRLAFRGTTVADAPGNEEQFAFAVPLRMLRGAPVTLRLEGRGRRAHVASTGALAAGRGTGLQAMRQGLRTTLRWDAGAYPLAVVRDANTGQIISLATGGAVELEGAGALTVTLSDRTASRTETLR